MSPPGASPPLRERASTFAFIDLAGFSALTEAHGDVHAADVAQRFVDLTATVLDDRSRLVKSIGDAVMLVFETPSGAVRATAALFGLCREEPGFPMPRAGLHHGPAVERDGDFFGATVNVAARTANLARGDQALATTGVAGAARSSGIATTSLGCFELHNLTERWELFELALGTWLRPRAVDPVCRMWVEHDHARGHLRHRDEDYWFCSLACAGAFASDPDAYTRSSPES